MSKLDEMYTALAPAKKDGYPVTQIAYDELQSALKEAIKNEKTCAELLSEQGYEYIRWRNRMSNVLEMALEALEYHRGQTRAIPRSDAAIAALKEAIKHQGEPGPEGID